MGWSSCPLFGLWATVDSPTGEASGPHSAVQNLNPTKRMRMGEWVLGRMIGCTQSRMGGCALGLVYSSSHVRSSTHCPFVQHMPAGEVSRCALGRS